MTPARWRQVTEIFHGALARDAGAREAFLRDACQGDPSLRDEVDALVAAHGEAGSFGSDPLFPDGALRLSAGTRLGTYQIVDLLGVGGMGEVYRAHDTELGRQVAIKILPAAWLAHPDRRARLDREARVLAALNHPHVAAIYGIAEANGVRGLVLELVEGVTLAGRLTEGPLPVTEALKVATQIAAALEATHEKGIVHRDLKPANIKITPDGVVKVLDFGVAKVHQAELSGARESPTETAARTGAEIIVGTAAYMSPEQARGKRVDKRADIWAFGCVLYEVLSGRRAFAGETLTDVLAAVIDKEPDWKALPATMPSSVRQLLQRCLEKDPKRRLRDIGDAKMELEAAVKDAPAGRAGFRGPWSAVGAAVLVVAVALLALPSIRSRFASASPDPSVVPLTSYRGGEQMPSLSPDGTQVAFRWNGESEDNFDIYVKLVGPGDPIRVTTDPAPEFFPRWSPDGKWIAFVRAQEGFPGFGVYVIPALGGGTERKVGVVSSAAFSWLPGEPSLVVSRRPSAGQPIGLYKLSVETGDLTQLTSPAAPLADEAPAVAPNGAALAFARVLDLTGIARLMLLPVSHSAQPSGEPREIDRDRRIRLLTSAWSSDGREIIYSAGWNANRASLWRVAVAGNAVAERLTFAGEGAVQPDVSRDGRRLVFSRYSSEESVWSLELDEAGRAAGQAVRAFDSTKREQCPAFSPDGKRVALESDRSGSDEIWVCQSTGQGCGQLTKFGGPHVGSPAWSPDGQWIAFDGSSETGTVIYRIRSDGGQPQRVAKGVIPRWSRDGRWIYYSNDSPPRLYRISPESGEPMLLNGTERGLVAEESLDRSWVYYSLQADSSPTKIRRTRPVGGDVTDVFAESIAGRNFVVVANGIWYMTPSSPTQGGVLRFYDFVSRLTRTVYQTALPVGPGLTLAPDGRRILFTHRDRIGSDLMLVENFR